VLILLSVSHLGTKLRHVAFSASRQHATGYSDRLFFAHFAIITFGLVASVGNWNDSFARFSIACGLSATMCVLCFGIDSPFIRGTLALWRGDSFFFIAPAREGSVSHETLDYIRHANLLAGAPPMQLTSISILSRGGLYRQTPAASLLRFFSHLSLSIFVRRNPCLQ
jgi:hypothetical protein